MAGRKRRYASIEVCAGAGGLALGVERAGFQHEALVEIDHHACATLRLNRPKWDVYQGDLRAFTAEIAAGRRSRPKITLLSGGVPCPPYSVAGLQQGSEDERDLFPALLDLAIELDPRAVMIENVPGLLQVKFADVRKRVLASLVNLGYEVSEDDWRIIDARYYGVPQMRRRAVLVALKPDVKYHFKWPAAGGVVPPTVGETLGKSMAGRGWEGAEEWAKTADAIAPTLVGGSKKHGGADLGPTRSKLAWEKLGVDAYAIADDVPAPGWQPPSHRTGPRLTVLQAALLQGFPEEWRFAGGKTAQYRQVGNAFPMPAAAAIAGKIMEALHAADSS